eukprot:gnl/TRDRNA2_/TRDRNA2_147151_c2_seq1.p1 gnl/TRDRNA2_/TRDRNA2_147151_c2~~gnl/TRDRNA2_/TRDRNA2_147151_c2_seq1.p1  ORF type:complete len:344 (+),score=32.54 gnl/TRDRNA2_/TRDRNA2_147151_c2_seq1:35-1033(+)
MGAVSLMSCIWFAETERTTATAISLTATSLGVTVGFLNPLWLAPNVDKVPRLFYLGTLLAIVPVLCALLDLPSRPAQDPSAAAAALTGNGLPAGAGVVGWWLRSCAAPFKNKSFVMLMLAAGVLAGSYNGWQDVLSSILNGDGTSDMYIPWIRFSIGIAANFGAIAGACVMDSLCRCRLKAGILVGLAMFWLCLLWLLLSLPCFLYSVSPLGHTGASLIASLALVGVFHGATTPLFFELGAELTFPSKESMSAGLLVGIFNGATLVMAQLKTDIASDNMIFIQVCVVGAAAVIVLVGVREAYRRPQNHAADAGSACDSHGNNILAHRSTTAV